MRCKGEKQLNNQLPSGEYRVVLVSAKRPAVDRLHMVDFVLTDNGERGRAILPEFSTKRGRGAWSALTAAGFIGKMEGPNRIWLPRDPAVDQPVIILALKFEPKYNLNTIEWGRKTGEMVPCDVRYVINYVEAEEF